MLYEEIKNIKSRKKTLRNFGIILGIFLVLWGILLLWTGREMHLYYLLIGGIFIFLGLFIPSALLPLQKAWMTAALIVGLAMTQVIITFLFYLMLTPIGFLSRKFGKQFLAIKIDKSQKTYWSRRKIKSFKKTDYERQF